jgi:hypothetical protein
VAVLSATQRKRLEPQDFVFPKERKYPIPDAPHARNALARGAQNASSSQEASIKAAVKRKFPAIKVEGETAKHRNDRAARRSNHD